MSQPTEDQLHRARVLIGDPQACALQRIRDYAASLCQDPDPDDEYGETGGEVTAEELIATALGNLNAGSDWPDYITKGGLLEGISVPDAFWNDLAIYQGITIPGAKRHNFFSCSC
jgi:hypothetical protein